MRGTALRVRLALPWNRRKDGVVRILITGHLGYIGTIMVPVLQQRGHDLVGLDSGLFADCVAGTGVVDIPEMRVDLRDVQPEHLRGFDAVVHLAALSNDPLGDLDPQHTYDINHHASVRLAELAKDAGVSRFCYSSSCSVYGASDDSALIDETAPMRPVTPYAESKVSVEADLHALADDHFSPVSMRNATAYGWSPRLRTDIVLNDLVARAFLTGKITVLSDGTPWRPIVHIEDISRAFAAVLEAPREAIHDQAFNVGAASENYQIRDLAEIVVRAVPGSEVDITGETGPDPRSYQVDFSKIERHVPAFQAVWTARKGAEELYEAYQRVGLTADAFGQRYKRMPWLTRQQQLGAIGPDLRPRGDTA
jgi:nucleoside-diphosphate-sugar epimerase